MKWRWVSMIAIAVLAAACGGSSPSTSGGKTGKDLNVAVVLKTFANPYWVAMKDGVTAEAQKLGAKVTIQAATSESAIAEQTSILQTMSGQSYNCFIVAPITGTNLIQPLVTVAHNNIPIINLDAGFDSTALAAANVKLTTFVASNNVTAGKLAGTKMSALLGGSGNVAVIGGLPGNSSSIDRITGFRQGATGLTVVQEVAADWDRVKALNAADTILRAQPGLKGFYAANDGMGLGVQQAVDNAGKTGKVFVMGTDGDPDAFQSIAANKYTATVSQYPYAMGVMGMEACLAKLQGKSVPATVDSPVALIEKGNLAQAQAAAPAPFGPYTDPFATLINQ
jgi:ABC-type sugar transport system substrate-binding protein